MSGLPSVKIFADGAEPAAIATLCGNPAIRGFTTNPTLMRQAGVTDYEDFARKVLEIIEERPVSFEVLADETDEMGRQARHIASWGENVYVKIPVTNTRGESCAALVRSLAEDGVRINVTALLTVAQVERVAESLNADVPALVSVFAGRIADTGRDPVPLMRAAVEVLKPLPAAELVWASPREILNVVHAEQAGCHVITITYELLKKLPLLGKDLDELSLETVRMFHRDAGIAGYTIDVAAGSADRRRG